jgi:transcription elongation factor SPT5
MEEEDVGRPDEYEEGDAIVQNAMQPSISDPKLWLVKCRPGKEKESVENLFHKYFCFNKDDDKVK